MSNYAIYRGKCQEMCEALVASQPELILVRGWYHDPWWGKQGHWWCVSPSGEIIDPTAKQFPSKGSGEYEPFDGMCECEECGKRIAETDAIFVGRYPVCSNKCALRLVGL